MQKNEKKVVKTIWLSDIHLGSKGCKAELLTEFLKTHQCETLYLVGDIIDGWRMKKNLYWPQTHSNVIRRILTLSKRGTNIIYVTGNHDEFLRKYSDSVFGNIHLVDEAEHKTVDGKKLLIVHGDEYDVVVRYHKWLAFLGDSAYNFLLLINRWFNALRQRLGYGYWSLSAYIKYKVKKAVTFIGEYEEALAQECKKRGYDGVVCGHIHHAEIKKINEITYLNCGDWVESCTALTEDYSGQITIVRWLEQAADYNIVESQEEAAA